MMVWAKHISFRHLFSEAGAPKVLAQDDEILRRGWLAVTICNELSTQNWSGQEESDSLIKTKHCDGPTSNKKAWLTKKKNTGVGKRYGRLCQKRGWKLLA
jgi:hypothetical protein